MCQRPEATAAQALQRLQASGHAAQPHPRQTGSIQTGSIQTGDRRPLIAEEFLSEISKDWFPRAGLRRSQQ